MKVHEILIEYQTKEGTEITLRHTEDAEKIQSPWVVHKIDAYIGDEHAGYIKVSYVPREYLKKFIPNIFSYLTKIKGVNLLPREISHIHYSKLSHEQLVDSFEMVYYYANHERYPTWDPKEKKYIYKGKFVNEYSKEELIEVYKEFEKVLIKQYGKQFQDFKQFHVDKPLVDYVRVNEPEEDPKRFRRKRIGEALYLAATEWMNSKGMKLYASGLQSDPAKATWEYFGRTHVVQKDKRGKYIKL